MHAIQQHILAQLMRHATARYRDLRPVGMDGNLFTYHLGRLIDEGLVIKLEGGYQLTPAGAHYTDRLSLATLQPRSQPKIVTLIACQNADGAWLFYRRRRQPFLDQVGFPYGKIHLGERVTAAAERELTEKTGITADLTHRGEIYLTVDQAGQLVSQMLAHIFAGSKPRGKLVATSPIGTCFWSPLADIPPSGLMPGVTDIIRLLEQSPHHFFEEFTCHL